PSPGDKAQKKITPFYLLSLDGNFDEKKFSFNFDVVPDVQPPDPTTYGSSYNEEFARKRQLIYQALQDAFFNVKTNPGVDPQAPIFTVIVVADITKGIATKTTMYLEDFKKYASAALPMDEYYMREHNEIIGREQLIGDKKGRALDYTEVTWGDFLTDQIKDRIRFKFTQSDFPPKSEPDNAIAVIAANTLSYYPSFTAYDNVYLYNIRAKKEKLYSKTEIKDLAEKPLWDEEKGRLTTIHFDASNFKPPASTKPAKGSASP
ncbi:MAG: hypothetical protein HQL19_07370, partial [Candidatus Omnitrophica bacterium]|nr:hypothetical protein [Candidatus Omnitrophota bacterium]